MRGNGERIGPQNLPTSSIAGGIWNLLNQQRAQQRGAWPSATPAVVTDPYFMYVPLLLNTTSTNGQQNNTFLDSSSNNFTITRNGTPTQGSFTPYQPSGYWSGYFSGTGDYLTAPSNSAFAFGTNDFTIECWVYLNASKAQAIVDTRSSGPSANGIAVAIDSSNFPYIYVNGTTLFTSSTALSNNVWNHLAVVKSSNVITLYINGVKPSTGSGTSTTNLTDTSLTIAGIIDARDATATYKLNGYASNVRLVKGVAVYTGAFTPPTAPLAATQSAGTNISAITGTATSLLTLQSNRFIDNSTNAFAITVNGTPKVQAFQPFSPAASYSAATYGGSGYFSGTTDYLNAPSNSAFTLSGNFTVEAWAYFTNTSSSFDSIMCTGPVGTLQVYISKGDAGIVNGDASANQIFWTTVYNQWVHYALVCNGSVLTMYVNGISVGTVTKTFTPAGTNLAIGRRYYDLNNYLMNGYISNFRIVKGTAVYTGNFTPPTLAPLTTAGSTSAASYPSTTNVNTSFAASNTSILTNFTNAGIYDAAWQNNALTVGDAQVSTTQAQWPTTSMKFDGTGDYLDILGPNQGFNLSSGNWTIEAWIYRTQTNKLDVILSMFNTINTNSGLSFYVNASNQLVTDNGVTAALAAGTVPSNQWVYVAIVRSGSTTTGYVNGTSVGTTTQAPNAAQYARIGFFGLSSLDPTWAFNGYIQDLRITKGVARTITTPTAAFPTR